MDDDAHLHEGLQSDPNRGPGMGCIHGTYWLNTCRPCIAELRDRERHEMMRQAFDRLSGILEKLEAKL